MTTSYKNLINKQTNELCPDACKQHYDAIWNVGKNRSVRMICDLLLDKIESSQSLDQVEQFLRDYRAKATNKKSSIKKIQKMIKQLRELNQSEAADNLQKQLDSGKFEDTTSLSNHERDQIEKQFEASE